MQAWPDGAKKNLSRAILNQVYYGLCALLTHSQGRQLCAAALQVKLALAIFHAELDEDGTSAEADTEQVTVVASNIKLITFCNHTPAHTQYRKR